MIVTYKLCYYSIILWTFHTRMHFKLWKKKILSLTVHKQFHQRSFIPVCAPVRIAGVHSVCVAGFGLDCSRLGGGNLPARAQSSCTQHCTVRTQPASAEHSTAFSPGHQAPIHHWVKHSIAFCCLDSCLRDYVLSTNEELFFALWLEIWPGIKLPQLSNLILRNSEVRPPIQMSVHLNVRPNVRPSVLLSILPSKRPSVCLSIHPNVRPYSQISICLSKCPSIHPTKWPSFQPSVHPSIRPSVRPSVLPSKYQN